MAIMKKSTRPTKNNKYSNSLMTENVNFFIALFSSLCYILGKEQGEFFTPPATYFSKSIRVSTQPTKDIILISSFSSCSTNLRSSFTIWVARLILSIMRITSLHYYNTIKC